MGHDNGTPGQEAKKGIRADSYHPTPGVGEPCPAPLRVAMRSPLPFPCVPDRPSKILLVQVWTLSFSHPSFGLSVFFLSFTLPHGM